MSEKSSLWDQQQDPDGDIRRQHADAPTDQPAGAEASGCELPTDLQRWLSSVFAIPVTAKQAAMVWASVGRWEPWVPEDECPTVDMLKKLVRFIERDELQFISTGVEFEWLEGLRKRIALIEANWHPAPASELAELRAQVERLKGERDAFAAQESVDVSQIATLTTQLASVERERDALREACEFFIAGYDRGCMASTDLSVPNVGHGVRLIRAALATTGDAANAE